MVNAPPPLLSNDHLASNHSASAVRIPHQQESVATLTAQHPNSTSPIAMTTAAFVRNLSPLLAAYLARQPVFCSAGLARFFAHGYALGWLEAVTLDFLTKFDPIFQRRGDDLYLPPDLAADQLAFHMNKAAVAMRERGLIRGWRDEQYDVFAPASDGCPDRTRPLFQLERAAFRRFGLTSHAVHVNGFTRDGRYWIGRRAAHKSIDPNRFDNLAAGGLPTGEEPRDCVVRELFEEAGIPPALATRARPTATYRTTRNEPDGTHDEILCVYDLTLPDDFIPTANDGEVAEFRHLTADELVDLLPEFTWDAGMVLARALAAASGDTSPGLPCCSDTVHR